MSPLLHHLYELVGERAVLLPIPKGKKGPTTDDWQYTTFEQTQEPLHQRRLESANRLGGNIGVLLGPASGNLCAIDIDTDAEIEAFLKLNPQLASSLRSRGQNGCQIWVKMIGEYPVCRINSKLKIPGKDKPVAEWRGGGGHQSVIYGKHPERDPDTRKVIFYRFIVEAPAIESAFDEVQWPERWGMNFNGSEPPSEPEPEPEAEPQPQHPKGEATPPLPEGIMLLPFGPVGFLYSASSIFGKIASKKPASVFIRGGHLARMKRRQVIEDVTPDEFRSLVEHFGELFTCTIEKGKLVPHPNQKMSRDVANVLLASSPKYLLPELTMIHRAPILVETKEGVQPLKPGYSPLLGGRYVASHGREDVYQMEPETAVKIVLELVEEYNFATPSDKSRAVALFISPALKMGELLQCHFPVFTVEADDVQAGKGYMLETNHAVYNEVPSLVSARKGGVGGFDEDLSRAMLNGKPFIQIDNVRTELSSQFWEMVMTVEHGAKVSCRTPYRQGIETDPSQFIFQLTSNKFESTPDLAARSLIVRILKREGHTFKTFDEDKKDLLLYIKANQEIYLSAIFTIIAEWVKKGKSRTADTRGEGRFRQWSQSLDWIIQNIFNVYNGAEEKLPPLLDGHGEIQKRMSNPGLSWLRSLSLHVKKQGLLNSEFQTMKLVELSDMAGLEIPHVPRVLDDQIRSRRVGMMMGPLFKGQKVIELDRLIMERSERIGTHHEMKIYVFKEA